MNLGLRFEYRIGRLKVPNSIKFIIFAIPSVLIILLTFLKVIDIKSDAFNENAAAFTVCLSCVQLQLIYISLVNNNELIIETMEFIEEIVDKSNLNVFN